MIRRNQILIYGLEENQRDRLSKGFNPFEFSSVQYHNKYDLLNNHHFLVCMNIDKMENDEYTHLIQYFENAEGNLVEYRLITVSRFELKKYRNVKIFKSFDQYAEFLYEDVPYLRRNLKLIENKVSSFVKVCRLLTLFREHSIVSTQSIINLTGYKSLEIRRYIEVLRIMGESIEYDFELNQWIHKNARGG